MSGVLTYPAFRKRGYASQVVRAATEYLNTASFDVALLWTSTDLEHFYGRFGWEHHPAIRTVVGPQESPKVYEAFAMIRFLSERAQENQADFESHPIYVGQHAW